jgi:hypothetical protein
MPPVAAAFAAIASYVATAYAAFQATAIGTWIAANAFLANVIGSIVLSVGIPLIQSLFTKKGTGTNVEAGKVNVRITEPPRWLAAGKMRQGGGVLFGEFDALGNFWYVVVHADSILKPGYSYILDDIPVTVDGSGYVTTNEFCLNDKKELYTGSGTRVPYVQIFTTTYTESNPTPPGIAALTAAIPTWTAAHKLVGTTYSVVKMGALSMEDRYKIYKWRGPFGLGEPAVGVIGEWSNAYDPRDGTQTNGVPSTYKYNQGNPVLIWAWFRTHRYGRNKPRTDINWTRIAEQAAICDQMVSSLAGSRKRYMCGTSIPEDKERATAEQEILMSMDAVLMFDSDGKCWPRVGYYVAPTLKLTRNRDIVGMESVEAQNGESETQGVIVRYMSPEANFTVQPAAAWYNPNYYVPGEAATFLTIDIITCQNHGQAMTLAKAIGMRSQPRYKLLPTVGLRGLRARQERIVNLLYDNTFSGDHEIATPVEVDTNGFFCGFGIVPVDANRWTLLSGEERAAPVVNDTVRTGAPDVPAGVAVAFNDSRVYATFVAPPREDVVYQFQYIASVDLPSAQWLDMSVDMLNSFAISGTVNSSVEYKVRWRSSSSGGSVTAWSSLYTLTPVANQVATLNSWIVEVSAGTPVIHVDSTGALTIDDHTRRYSDGHADVAVDGAAIATGLAVGDTRSIGYDDPARVGGAVTYNLYADDNDAHVSAAYPGRHYVGFFTVPATGSGSGGGGGVPGGSSQYDLP